MTVNSDTFNTFLDAFIERQLVFFSRWTLQILADSLKVRYVLTLRHLKDGYRGEAELLQGGRSTWLLPAFVTLFLSFGSFLFD